jgi:hypothetical protein
VSGSHSYSHQVIYEDGETIAFLNRYCLSLGSQQGNAHLHRHVTPLPRACRMSSSSTTR